MSVFAPFLAKVAPVPVPDHLAAAVAELSRATSIEFEVTDGVAAGTELHIVYARKHPLPPRFNQSEAILGFRVPRNYPDAAPEDLFFLITPQPLRLAVADPVRNSNDVHRVSLNADVLKGTPLEGSQALVFSWHLWDRSPWNRRKHTLVDHYTHSIRRFEQAEHD